MIIFLIRLVLGAFAFIGHAAATDNVSAEYLSSVPFVINPNGVACHDGFHVTSARLCVVAAKRIKITKSKINISTKFQPPYGCSLRGKTVYFNRDKNAKLPQKSVTPICRILPDCCTCDPDPSMNPSKRLSVEPSVEPSVSTSTPEYPSEEPSLMHTVDPSTFTFNGSKKLERAQDENDYDGTVAKPHIDYTLKFTIEPQGKLSVWSNIIHITTGGKCCEYGFMVPIVFFEPDTTRLIVSGGSGNESLIRSVEQLPINIESEIVILVAGTISTLIINGVAEPSTSTGDRSLLSDVKVYLGSPREAAADAIISNVYFGPA